MISENRVFGKPEFRKAGGAGARVSSAVSKHPGFAMIIGERARRLNTHENLGVLAQASEGTSNTTEVEDPKKKENRLRGLPV